MLPSACRSGHLGRKYAKARQRKALPYAWGVLGEGGDFDQARRAGPRPLMLVSATTAGGGEPCTGPALQLSSAVPCCACLQVQHLGQISRADYAQAIGEEL